MSINLLDQVKYMPESARKMPFIVARTVDGALWFWGAYTHNDEAQTAAKSIKNGVLISTGRVK